MGFDDEGPNDSQGYISHVAARALVFIEADTPAIRLMCVIPVGMSEVSSCVLRGPAASPCRRGSV